MFCSTTSVTKTNERLEQLQLLQKERPPSEPLRTLCHHGFLRGGLSIALDVKIDEALGPLLEAIGGPARTIRVLDIQGQVFSVKIGTVQHEWEIDGLESLIDTLNRAFARSPEVNALVFLGEWEDMLQVWAIPKPIVATLLTEEWFVPSNVPGLRAALSQRGSAQGRA